MLMQEKLTLKSWGQEHIFAEHHHANVVNLKHEGYYTMREIELGDNWK